LWSQLSIFCGSFVQNIVMRAVIQRVSEARVKIAGETVGEIGPGLLVFLGVAPADTPADALWLAEKIAALRLFPDAAGKMNLSVRDLAPSSGLSAPRLLIISQFTLFASTRKGTRPSWDGAARPDHAIPLYEKFCELCTTALGRPVATGRFGADMQVSLVNDGPVTLLLDTAQKE
jgi:D-tyrosyl-tRNA(Tyr) deacylase